MATVHCTCSGRRFWKQEGASANIIPIFELIQDLEEQKRTKYKINGTAISYTSTRIAIRYEYEYSN